MIIDRIGANDSGASRLRKREREAEGRYKGAINHKSEFLILESKRGCYQNSLNSAGVPLQQIRSEVVN